MLSGPDAADNSVAAGAVEQVRMICSTSCRFSLSSLDGLMARRRWG
ncbi:hypothetical protein HMPREF1162_0608 [ [[Propionibacterium] namnetense SK182B-JCVI]|uniref:Uncharacterized protein n=1 Tax=[Propionibacterium] namnetense SK182B-JCVI TaxID=1051006 RepID=F9NU77_9ACTN|nr:hypothetical protein HMPREF1162_0608 [ [[Propionibacterium] namnetense SK182B-JCVI]